jgi:hypothetical protein
LTFTTGAAKSAGLFLGPGAVYQAVGEGILRLSISSNFRLNKRGKANIIVPFKSRVLLYAGIENMEKNRRLESGVCST